MPCFTQLVRVSLNVPLRPCRPRRGSRLHLDALAGER
jgi:hypothetical protein